MRKYFFLILAVLILSGPAAAQQPPPQPPPGFVPVEDVPESEKIPAINLVAAAYGFVWVVVVGYALSLATRLKKVERDLGDLEKRGR